jgi:enoyl-CoA hydratase/carnithine racemase
MLGDPVRATEAERIGLISELTEEGRADETSQRLAHRLAQGPALAYAQTKALLTSELDMPLAASVELDASTQALLMNGADYAEFHAAFTEKRPPKWSGR